MDRLWAPWRMAYVAVERPVGCVFCQAPGDEDERRRLVLYRGETCFIIMNLFPYNGGHLMVVPYRHTSDLVGLTPEEQQELMVLTRHAIRALKESMRPDAFNVGMNLGRSAGAGIEEHLHQHIVPRWHGDMNFMPVIGETRVLPEALLESYDKLKAAFDHIGMPQP